MSNCTGRSGRPRVWPLTVMGALVPGCREVGSTQLELHQATTAASRTNEPWRACCSCHHLLCLLLSTTLKGNTSGCQSLSKGGWCCADSYLLLSPPIFISGCTLKIKGQPCDYSYVMDNVHCIAIDSFCNRFWGHYTRPVLFWHWINKAEQEQEGCGTYLCSRKTKNRDSYLISDSDERSAENSTVW